MVKKTENSLDLGMKKLSATEEKIMQVIWEHPEGISSEKIYEQFNGTVGAVGTMLFKISKKGYVENVQCGRHHTYKALVSKSEYEQALSRRFINKTLNGISFDSIVAAFTGKNLNDEQLKKVKDFLEDIENDMDDK